MVGYSVITQIYQVQGVLAALLLIIMLMLIMPPARILKIAVSILAIVFTILHYYLILRISAYGNILVLPLTILETHKNGSTISLDFGQLMIILLIALWRRSIARLVRRLPGKKGSDTG